MIRRICSFAILAAVILSCINAGKNEASSKTEDSEKAVKVEFASLIENPDNYVNKNIIVEGKVIHVCTMSGKKMFIVGENPDVRLFIAAGENMPKFPMELLGSEVAVEGLITKAGGQDKPAGAPHSAKREVMRPAGGVAKTLSGDSCETELALSVQPALANIIMDYKSHTVK